MKQMRCPECGSSKVIRYGKVKQWINRKRVQKQNYLCNNCGRRFMERKNG